MADSFLTRCTQMKKGCGGDILADAKVNAKENDGKLGKEEL